MIPENPSLRPLNNAYPIQPQALPLAKKEDLALLLIMNIFLQAMQPLLSLPLSSFRGMTAPEYKELHSQIKGLLADLQKIIPLIGHADKGMSSFLMTVEERLQSIAESILLMDTSVPGLHTQLRGEVRFLCTHVLSFLLRYGESLPPNLRSFLEKMLTLFSPFYDAKLAEHALSSFRREEPPARGSEQLFFFKEGPKEKPPAQEKQIPLNLGNLEMRTLVKEEKTQFLSYASESLVVINSPTEKAHMEQVIQNNFGVLPFAFIVPYPWSITFQQRQATEAKEEKRDQETKKKGQKGAKEERAMVFVLVPKEHPEDIDSFSIATTPLTNVEFTSWLNDMWDLEQIVIGEKGEVRDLDDRLLCATQQTVSTSDIQIVFEEGTLFFQSVKGKELYPLVHVTAYGAEAYCRSEGFRLPTEQEWEKAAANKPLKKEKFLYGCSSDAVDSSLANYATFVITKSPYSTSPVGFFSGQTTYMKDGERIDTKEAKSPYGCYDMSGNVREWTSSFVSSPSHKIVKGGSFLDREEDLLVAAYKEQSVHEHTSYTGFRVAF